MIKVVGFEGGPCGGKTTAIDYVGDNARAHDIHTIIIPEVASQKFQHLQENGISYDSIRENDEDHIYFQTDLLQTIVRSIKRAKQVAHNYEDTLILVDRVDNAAYISKDQYKKACRNIGYIESPMHSLVDTIVYFPSLAKLDSEKYEAIANQNPYRYEDAEMAINRCNENYASVRTHKDIWCMHEESFERSLRYAANIALRGFGIHSSLTHAH